MMFPPILELFPQGGWFVEAGAHDGVGDSTTKHLEDAGWQGLCVEPSPAYRGLALNRRCKTDRRVLGRCDGEHVIFREMQGEAVELSGIRYHFYDAWDREGRPHQDRGVRTSRLPTLLAWHGLPSVIEFLSLDTEGSEVAILTGHDFERFRFRTILVEYNGVARRRQALTELLRGHGYRVVKDDGQDLFLFHGSMP